MRVEELTHVVAHGFAVDFEADVAALQSERGDFEFPGVGDNCCGVEEATRAFFGDILGQGVSAREVWRVGIVGRYIHSS